MWKIIDVTQEFANEGYFVETVDYYTISHTETNQVITVHEDDLHLYYNQKWKDDKLNYQDYVLSTFKDHHDCMGLSNEEIEDMINETSFSSIEQWLMNVGYNLNEYYN